MTKKTLFFYTSKYGIYTSYKVAFSSLGILYRKGFLSFTDDLTKSVDFIQENTDIKVYGLIRDPKKRIESLFKDKCILSKNPNIIQQCQKPIIDIFSYNKFFEQIITFEEFVLNLDKLVETNAHFYPQHYFIPTFVNKYLYLDNQQDIEYIENYILLTKFIKTNQTYNINFTWTTDMLNVFMNIYGKDYELYYQ